MMVDLGRVVFRVDAEYWLAGLLVLLLMGPVGFYLRGSWAYRRQEILGLLSQDSVTLYFRMFYPAAVPAETTDFGRLYATRFGRRRYVTPALMLAATGWIVSTWLIEWVFVATHRRPATDGILDTVSVAALSGGFLWVVADLIARWRSRDLLPADLWWSSWRIALSVPMGYAVAATLKPELSVPIAFLLGAFPTRSISTMARRLARQLNLGADSGEKAESELEKLQGIDTRIAERFADEGVTTIVQLAYADPVEMTMRCASFTFSFVVDCASQALAWLYLGDDLAKLRVYGLRGAQEIHTLVAELAGGATPEAAAQAQTARQTLDTAAKVIGVDPCVLERTLSEIAEDPYTAFIAAVWAGGPE